MREQELDEDRTTMLRLKGGDDLALNELMSRWQHPLAAFIQRYTGNAEDALDLAQETFVRVYESRHRYKPRAKFSTWMFTIASNLCRNHARWRTRHPTVALESSAADDTPSIGSTLPAPGHSPAESAEREDVAAAVRAAIQSLPHDLRTAVLLFEYQDQSYDEIASALGCTAKAVETRLYRARKILRDLLSGGQIR